MKFIFLAYLFTPSGEYLWKDVMETPTMEACESMTQSYSKTIINTGNQASFFCLTEEQYNLGRQEEYEGTLNPIDEHEPDETSYLPEKIRHNKCTSKEKCVHS